MTTKQQRQRIIVGLIGSRHVSSQPELRRLLASEGVQATQATISRDLDELGAVKIRVSGSESAYAIPDYEPARVAPGDQLRRVMGEWVAEVTHSGPLVIVRTPPGCAHVVASALDRAGDPDLLGTVAGDDTILCVASERLGGRDLAARLRTLAGMDPMDASASPRVARSRRTHV
jgi:transcriptional regulator of arginine metabolism